MVKQILKYSLLLGIMFAFVTCDKLIYDQQIDKDGDSKPTVFLSVARDKVSSFRSSPDLPDDPTINEDVADWEDRVNALSLLVFDTATGDLEATHFDDAGSNAADDFFVIELTPGQRDFYFVANMPVDATLTGISNRTDMEDYLSGLYNLSTDLYDGASSDGGFPMSRVYKNHEVIPGGTVYIPAPFNPKNDSGDVEVNKDNEGSVLLIRVVAKLEVKVPESEIASVKSIKLKNAYKQFHLQHGLVTTESGLGSVAQSINNPHTNILHSGEITLAQQSPENGYYSYIAYMPEALMNNASWTDGASNEPINFFVIENQEGITWEVPIITENINYGFSDNYLQYAKNNSNSEKYNIYRNRRYLYEVKNLSDIEIEYKVKEWDIVENKLFMGYGYNVIIDGDGKITIENTIDDCMPHKVRLEALNGAYFGTAGNETIEYGYLSAADDDYHIDKTKTGYFETFDALYNADVTTGDDYLEIYYNNILVKTYTK